MVTDVYYPMRGSDLLNTFCIIFYRFGVSMRAYCTSFLTPSGFNRVQVSTVSEIENKTNIYNQYPIPSIGLIVCLYHNVLG